MKIMEGRIENYFLPVTDIGAGISGIFPFQKELKWSAGPSFVLSLGHFTILTEPFVGLKNNKVCYLRIKPTENPKNTPVERFYDMRPFENSHFDLLLSSRPVAEKIGQKAINVLDKEITAVSTACCTSQLKGLGFKNINSLAVGQKIIFNKQHESLSIAAVKGLWAKSQEKNNAYIIEYVIKNKRYRIYWSGDTIRFNWK